MSNAEFDARIEMLFAQVKDLPDEQQQQFLNEACANHPLAMRGKLERLLAADRQLPDTELADDSLPESSVECTDMLAAIGRYRLLAELGRGSFGRVFLAHDDQLDRPIAIKVPRARFMTSSKDIESYLSEARLVARLDHPAIVPVYDVGHDSVFPLFIVSKYIAGATLDVWSTNRSNNYSEAAQLAARLAEALHYAHVHGLVHRDVKPRNVLIDQNGQSFLADFGLALRATEIGRGPKYIGTPAYMSPEQARREGHRVDGRSDIFSLGIVLYELLTGRRPFLGDTETEVLHQITQQEARPPRQIDDRIPKKLERIVLKALAKRIADRYTTAKDFAEELLSCLEMTSTGENRRKSTQLKVQLKLGRFELLMSLGAGGFGNVFDALDQRTNTHVRIRFERQWGEAEAKERLLPFRRTMELRHPNILSVVDVGIEDGNLIIVTQPSYGSTLVEFSRSRDVEPDVAAQLCRKIADALNYAHSKGLIHGDLKTTNVYVDSGMEPFVDFTETVDCKIMGNIVPSSDLCGTPAYMAPERLFAGHLAGDERVDQFSLGVILYQLLTGVLPFGRTMRELAGGLVEQLPVPPRSISTRIPPDLEAICLKCLSFQPDDRYRTALELEHDLQRFLQHEPVQARQFCK